ncbi:hypothetical protein ThrDRAFT_03729 [Frankia casuarinae]|uniref:YcaO domain-containing protein n=1 Tax=Frankia casuarinae (strain DSM 45818 / CECT 9043 / HFP020203 / CcI3) TaxID=106370 RepID=Q2J597_FRACC|nr:MULTISPECIES: hypothetical protein [Frankia]ABD13545.1 hypothetical protein Francci3_4197 [Frankia casuarinae]EYT90624.1 hypothetical protein ThrDRAFT_03729 [Frankia casuarinae]TFE24686.1 hypothetical protein E0F15_21090 [Frankia sp. B2]
MKIKSRTYLHYAPVPGGVYFSGPTSQFVMRGPELLFTIADLCVPLLEEGTTEDDLVRALGTEKARPAVRKVVDGLLSHDMLLDTAGFTVAETGIAERDRFPEALAHLEAFTDDPYAAFAALRTAHVVLYGPAAVVSPAARGLARAGAGHLALATPDGDLDPVRAVGERLGARLLSDQEELKEALAEADAVLWCPGEDGEPAPRVSLRPAGWLVPVSLGEATVVGPVLDATAASGQWPASAERALSWAHRHSGGPVARPGADRLAGALAGQLLFDALTNCAASAEAHVVHGDDLAADRVTVPGAQSSAGPATWCSLDSVAQQPAPDEEEALERIYQVTAPWTGLFQLVTDDALPQMPLALRQIEYRLGRTGSVVGWGAGQRAATVAVVLDALRALRADEGVGAAGFTPQQWLLDGALRLLVERARTGGAVNRAELPADDRMVLRLLTDESAQLVVLLDLEVAGLDWRLARVEGEHGKVLGVGWGRDQAEARHAALGTALAHEQARRLLPDVGIAHVNTAALLVASAAELAALSADVVGQGTAEGIGYLGLAHRSDPVLGDLPYWSGTVEARRRDPEDGNA